MTKSLYCGLTKGATVSHSEAVMLLPLAGFFQLRGLQRCCEITLYHSLTLDNAIDIYHTAKHHRATELCRFCEGFFLQNMEQLLVREDFHRLLLGCLGRVQPYLGLGTVDQTTPHLLRVLETTLIDRLYDFHSAC